MVATQPGHPDGSKVKYNPSSGGRVVSQTDSEGAFRAELADPLDRGRSNEPYAVAGLIAVLKAQGRDVHRLK